METDLKTKEGFEIKKEKAEEEKRKMRLLEYQKHFKCFRMGKTGGGQRA